MTIATLAHGARQSLARGLEALQSLDAPPRLLDVAQPVARAMGMLVELEQTPDTLAPARIEPTLAALREGLRLLQLPELVEHPAAARGLAAVAETLAVVLELARSIQARPRVEPSLAAPSWNETLVAHATTLQALVPTVAPARPERQRPPPPEICRIEPTRIESTPRASAPGGASVRVEPERRERPRNRAEVPPVQALVPTLAPGRNETGRAHRAPAEPPPNAALQSPATVDIEPAPSTRVSNTRPPVASATAPEVTVAAPKALSQPPVVPKPPAPEKQPQPKVVILQDVANIVREQVSRDSELRVIDAPLGVHSPSNFYAGLSSDVLGDGGLFVATYQLPEVGETVLLEISMPGGYEFTAKAIVTWIRTFSARVTGTRAARATAAPPGFGARFSEITEEGRCLVQRYVRNREPLFHDDP